ncbi:MAG: hypothetical protein J7L66_01965 [Anaerolineaceae bacterium]|nr:hypothetical protein [Anaerolineaceae bacterium]
MKRFIKIISLLLIAAFSLAGCNFYNLVFPKPTATLAIPTPVPLTELNICLGYEPRSLYRYQVGSQAGREILRALYDGPIDVFSSGEKEAVILEKIPNFSDGSASFTSVAVNEGDEVVNSYGDLVSLKAGTPVFPAGCTSASCVVKWDGTSELAVNQLTVTYTLKEGLKWSDGQPLTAADSVYAFQVAADPATPINKRIIDLTESYTALDDTAVQWVAKPGFVSGAFEDFFWAPLPQHAWGGYSADQLLTLEDVNRAPLSWGPFMVEEWQTGSFIRLVKNPYYFRANEGLPKTDILTFKFLSNVEPEALLVAAESECDIVSPTALGLQDIVYLSQNVQGSNFDLYKLHSEEVELLAFGIVPYSYDDNYYPYGVDRPDIFGDVRTRRAIAYCIDRDTITKKLMGGAVQPAVSILDINHPLVQDASLSAYSYDPANGAALLKQVGWADADQNPATPLTAASVFNVPPGTAFEVELLTSESSLRNEIAAEIAAYLSGCGIRVNITQMPLNELYQSGPDGPIFGRKFDLALLSWKTDENFACDWFTTAEIPNDANYWLGEKTGGANYYGFLNTTYDQACDASRQHGLDAASSNEVAQEALSILSAELPFIPLYQHPSALLVSNELADIMGDNIELDDLFFDIEKLEKK